MARNSTQLEIVTTLSDVVTISRQFLRSVRIDTDVGRADALSGYICQGTARGLLESMARQIRDTRQRAFTWTGPYGGGKSSLALLLCSLVGPDAALRSRAKEILGPLGDSAIPSAFKATGEGWLVVPVVGKRTKVSDSLSKALVLATQGEPQKRRKEQLDVIEELKAKAEQHPQGVLVVIDELGKFLESAARDGEDVYFFQELAEAASRSNGRLVVVGILHQSFDAYAARLDRQARDDWAKVQGRFIDIPLVAATDEMIELIGRAIEVQPTVDRRGAAPFAKVVAHSVRERRPGTPPSIEAAIARCWPLHPVVASLLGPISRRRFSQNERSTFGFLASREPLGFVEFLDGSEINWASMYGPSRYWDYLRANVEQAILASPDGHRWAVASEAVERSEARGTSLHIELTKCVALIEMFRTGSGLVPGPDVLGVCIQGASPAQVQEALQDLVGWKILIERKHLGAFGVFAGSDFDIEAAVTQSRTEIGSPDLQQIATLADLQPILAKRHYHETGTMRWFTRRIARLDEAATVGSATRDRASVGEFLLCLPDLGTSLASARRQVKDLSEKTSDQARVISIPENATRIAELSLELVACERVLRTRPELEGDSVARKELIARTSAVRSSLEEELGDAFSLSKWYWKGELQDGGRGSPVTLIASLIADQVYPETPHIHSELINREAPSSNSNKARKDLMYRMLNHANAADLAYSGFPADAGLYFSVLKYTGLHRERDSGQWQFGDPYASEQHGALFTLWYRTENSIFQDGTTKTLSDLYEYWAAPPFGVRRGVMPIVALVFFLAHRSTLALYMDGVFTPDLSEALIDEWLLDPKRIALKYVAAASDQRAYMQAVAASLPTSNSIAEQNKPLDVARALVGLVVGLPNLTRRTNNLSSQASAVRGMLLKANDPNKVLFADLPALLEARDADDVTSKLRRVTDELVKAYPNALNEVNATVLKALDQADGNADRIRDRAKVVKGIAGEFRLEAFVARLETYDGSEQAVEGLISLASDKPPAQWVDRDIDRALLQLASWAYDFRRAETVAPLRGRPSTRRAIGVVFGGGLGREATTSFDIDDRDSTTVSKLAGKLIADLQSQPRELALAALAEAGALLVNATSEEVVQ